MRSILANVGKTLAQLRRRVRGQRSNAALGGPNRHAAKPNVESLEERCLMSASPFYSIDGTGNNPAHFNWGSVGQDLLRTAPAQYGAGGSAIAGANRPSARAISDAIVSDASDGNTSNNRFMSDWVYAWGQFIDHDIDLTSGGTGTQFQEADIAVPKGDAYFDLNNTGTQVISFTRSEFDPKTGTSSSNPRQQINDITAWLDGSQIYGSDPARADALRAHHDGLLLTSAGDMLPFNTGGFANANEGPTPADHLYLAGDVRANENIELTAVHTLFMREHNRIAGLIKQAHPTLDDDTIYQYARSIVIAEEQAITFNEFLPALLGPNAIPSYRGYNSTVNPGIANEFSTAGFRVGHTLVGPDVEFLNPDGTTKFPEVDLADAFFNPGILGTTGVDPIFKYLSTDNAQEVDNMIVPQLQNFLFGAPGQGGFDLASLNIQRGRDHGLADYNTTRVAYGLPRLTSFSQISSDPTVVATLKLLYKGNINNVDLWVGGLAEDHAPGASVGPLFQRIIAKQFLRLRDGDRLWYENTFSGAALYALKHTTLAQIIANNTDNKNLQANVFYYKAAITGAVFNDANGNGTLDQGETAVAGRIIQLVDATGAIVATTTTRADGSYSFDNLSSDLEAGVGYTVREVLPDGVTQTTADPTEITITRGQTIRGIVFGNTGPGLRRILSRVNSILCRVPDADDSGVVSGGLDLDDVVNLVASLRR
ncbi:MAG TPA: peroxidase family protein [Gemmataceae bacterium]|nr:peroxidase family protein [Gemmataceae bacterium]